MYLTKAGDLLLYERWLKTKKIVERMKKMVSVHANVVDLRVEKMLER